MRTITHREYLTRLAWLDEQWNKPDRTDHYLMQIAARVQQVLAKNPSQHTLEKQKLKFQQVKPLPPPDKKTVVERMKQGWCSLVGLKRGR